MLVGAAALLLAAGGAVLLPPEGPALPPDPAAHPSTSHPSTSHPSTSHPSTSHPVQPLTPVRSAPGPVGRTPQAPADHTDPRRALRELVARRGEALRTGDARLLEEVYAPGAEAAVADRGTIARARGDFPELVLEVESVRDAPVGSVEPGRAVLVAEVRVDGYRGGPGTIPSVVPAGNGWVQTVLVVLVDGERGWRLAAVEPAAGSAASPGPDPGEQEPARQDPRG